MMLLAAVILGCLLTVVGLLLGLYVGSDGEVNLVAEAAKGLKKATHRRRALTVDTMSDADRERMLENRRKADEKEVLSL